MGDEERNMMGKVRVREEEEEEEEELLLSSADQRLESLESGGDADERARVRARARRRSRKRSAGLKLILHRLLNCRPLFGGWRERRRRRRSK